MGAEQQQEVKSLPRNRKCGNCRYFEPAPLWRKGWCRNPQLYPPHANHLVDSATIDCEGGFRSRIYWEPIPQAPAPQPATPEPRPQVNRGRNGNSAERDQGIPQPPMQSQAHSGAFGPKFDAAPPSSAQTRKFRPGPMEQVPIQPQSQYVEPVAQEVYYSEPELEEEVTYQEPKPAEVSTYRRPSRAEMKNAAAHNTPQAAVTAQPKPSVDWRESLYRNFPASRNWNLENFKMQSVFPWVAVSFLALVLLLFWPGSNKVNTGVPLGETNDNGAVTSAEVTPGSVSSGTLITTTPGQSAASGSSSKTPATSASTVSGAGNATTPKPASNSIAGKTGTVNSPDGINVRKDPSTTGDVLRKLKKGDIVTIVDGPKTGDGLEWYQVKTSDVTGWVAKKYIDVSS